VASQVEDQLYLPGKGTSGASSPSTPLPALIKGDECRQLPSG